MTCPSFETLAQYALEELSKPMRDEITDHLSRSCQFCNERLSWLQATTAALNEPLDEGPDLLLEQARQLFIDTRQTPPQDKIIFAVMVFDSIASGARQGTRGGLPAMVNRRLLYHADFASVTNLSEKYPRSFDIDVAIKRPPGADNYAVRGQIMLEHETAASIQMEIELFRQGKRVRNTAANIQGEFAITNLAEGDYNLQIRSANWIVVINLPVVIDAKL